MKMKNSKVLERLKAGKIVTCAKTNFADSRPVEIACIAGFDCIWTDAEHVPNDWMALEKQVLAAKAYDTDIVIRIPRGGYSDYIRPLEMDATGIMVPHVMGAEDVKHVVRMTRFYPVGLRPVDSGNADGLFCGIPMSEYMAQANEKRILIVQIEDKEAIPELDEICSTDGTDIIFFGAGDYSQSLGVPGQIYHEEVNRVRELIPKIAKKYGKFAGAACEVEDIGKYINMGYSFISIASDVTALRDYYRRVHDGAENFR